MTIQHDEFQCGNCKKVLKISQRSNLSGSTRKLVFYTLNKVAPSFNNTEEICKACTRQVYIWFAFLILIVILSPFLNDMRAVH